MATAPSLRNEVVEKEIAGHVYKIELLGAKKGKAILTGLVRNFGPAFDGDDPITKICAALTDVQMDLLCDTFAKQTRYSPVEKPEAEFFLDQTFDKHFSGKYGVMTLWLKACLEANYGGFLQELGVDAGSLKDLLAAAMSASPKTSTAGTGQSGDLSSGDGDGSKR